MQKLTEERLIKLEFQTKLLLLSFAITIVFALIIVPILRKLKIGQIERSDGPESHLKKQGTPTMGGIIIMLGIIAVTTGAYIYYKSKDATLASSLLPILGLTIGFGLVGFVDDFKKLVLKNTEGLKPSLKMLGLLLISVIFVLYLIKGVNLGTETYIPILKQYIEIPIFVYIPFAILVILATTNAVNLTDGIDGLSSSVCTIIITCLTVIATMFGVKELVVFGAIVIGAVLAFLIFNIYPAKVFMGDTGSLFLGGVISGVALYLKMPLILLIVAFIPVLETISVILQVASFKLTGKRIFRMAPIHHHFELCGWKENHVVMIFCIITLMVSIIGLQIV
ncbi:MAG: phospho-N-acetylmuramoyl-pentapeptide-transferase [Clostridia bacterium]|nr:phospho-N-acetylmuramoyl-pentapeptide-transferase [Clostridia bacterium]